MYCDFDDDIAFQFFPQKKKMKIVYMWLGFPTQTRFGFLAKTHFPKFFFRVNVENSRFKSVCAKQVLVIVYK
jgi:hypothetical protein